MLAHFAHELQALVGPRIAGEEYVAVMVLSIARTAAKLPFCMRHQKIVLHSLFVFVFHSLHGGHVCICGKSCWGAPGIVVTSPPPPPFPDPSRTFPQRHTRSCTLFCGSRYPTLNRLVHSHGGAVHTRSNLFRSTSLSGGSP